MIGMLNDAAHINIGASKWLNSYSTRLLRLRGVIARALPNALPEKSMHAIYRTPKICKFPHL